MDGNPEEGDSDMSWEHDSPVVIFKDPRPFAEYANEPLKRSFDAFAEGEHLPQSRSFEDHAMTYTLGPEISHLGNTLPTNPVFEEARDPGGDNSNAWLYFIDLVEAPYNWFSSLTVKSIARIASTNAWKDFAGRTRYHFSGNRRIETVLTAIEQIAEGTKRRQVELATSVHYEKRMSKQEQHRRHCYHRARASERDREHIYSAQQQAAQLNIQLNVPDNDLPPDLHVGQYFMSGALADDDIGNPRTPPRLHVMPGTWLESPDTDTGPFWNTYDDDDDDDEIHTDLINPGNDETHADSGNPENDELHTDSANPENDINAIAASPSAPNEVLATNPAWPYCGNEIHHVELKLTDVDDEDSIMTATEEGISDDSIIAPENLDTASSSDSIIAPENLDTASSSNSIIAPENLDITSSSDSDDHDMLDTDNPATPALTSLSGPYAFNNNTSPDAFQRAAADEMQAIVDESMLSEDLSYLESPNLPSEVPSSPSISNLVDETSLIQTPRAATGTASVSGMSPLSLSNYSRSTESTPNSNASHYKISPRDSPAWSYTRSPKHMYSSPFRHSPTYHPMPSPVRFSPYRLALSRAGSPKKRVTFFQSPKTGRPVNRYKKYIIGESMDVSYVSASEEDYSMLSDTSVTGRLYTSPTGQEHREQQSMIGKKEQELYRPLPFADFAPVDAHAHIPVNTPQRVFSDITNARTRKHRDVSDFAVITAGSPMHSKPPIAESKEDIKSSFDNEVLALAQESHNGKENKSPLTSNQTGVLAVSPLTVSSLKDGSSSPSSSTHAVIPTQAPGSLAHETESCSLVERSLSNQTTHIPATSNPASEGTLAHGKDDSSNEDYSPSNQIEPSAALTPPSLSSFQGPSMDDNDSASQALSTSNSSEPSTATDTPEDRSDDEVLGNEKSTLPPASLSIQSRTPVIAATPDLPSAEGILGIGIDSTSTINGMSPLDQLGVSDVPITAESSLAEGTLVIGKESISTKDGSSSSDQVDAPAIDSTPAPTLTGGTLVIGKDSPSAAKGSSLSDQVDAPVTTSPSSIERQIAGLDVSGRRSSIRLTTKARKDADRRAAKEARIAADKARKEKEKAEEKARKKKELAAERRRTGARRTPVVKVIEPLSNEWEARVTEAMKEKHLMKVVTTSVAATEITRRDLGKVLPQPGVPGESQSGWLNDTIVTAYLDTVVDHALKTAGHKRGDIPKQVAFSTYFYPRLAKEGAASVTRWVKRAKVEGKNMKNVERIYIPINQNENHWTLLVISPKFKMIEYFDSFHGDPSKVIDNAKKLLKNEMGDEFKEREWTVKGRGGPRQTNGSDCGVFVSTTVKMISLGVEPMAYSATDIPLQRRRIVAELMNRGFDGDLAPNVVFADDDDDD